MPWWGWLLVALGVVVGAGGMYLGLMAWLAQGFRW